ncbi:TlpA family protein disulfide reductase [Candidatus Saganbacteria bacterium]|uniref:TlpA family protein disulfide reductase n=1 Tax=Candidatus Saganbacteria bacterium TaxID=2575572 RepID=A0A9D6UPD8_UNCSA|nr:TlpA family protein disulfide reductase [Candidatus Saganbacteria bacterium]
MSFSSVPAAAKELSLPEIGVGKRAIDFSLPDLEGRQFKLSNYRGKIVFLHFWTTWCPPCREELPSLQAVYKKFKKKNFEILAVSLDRPAEMLVKPFMKKNGYTFKVLLDPEKKVASRYKVNSIPVTFIINRKGRIANKIIGARNWSEEAVSGELEKLFGR